MFEVVSTTAIFSKRIQPNPKYVAPLPKINNHKTPDSEFDFVLSLDAARRGTLYDMKKELELFSLEKMKEGAMVFNFTKKELHDIEVGALKACTGKAYTFRDELRAMDFRPRCLPPLPQDNCELCEKTNHVMLVIPIE
jgi:hypothetical protein